jgi:hypothetical protein
LRSNKALHLTSTVGRPWAFLWRSQLNADTLGASELMLASHDVERAVSLQRKAYAVLVWFQRHLDHALFPRHEAHAAMGSVGVARMWVEENLHRLPPEARPATGELELLANMFASYLTTSFDVVDRPSYRLETTTGCLCEICAYMAQCSHLQPKRLSPGDKAHAQRLKVEALTELAATKGHSLSRGQALEILGAPDISTNAALVAYAKQLILRLGGDQGDPAVLALWREFAWTREGAPKRDFTLEPADIMDAQSGLLAALGDAAKT